MCDYTITATQGESRMNAQFFEKRYQIRVQEKYAIRIVSESGERGVLPPNSAWDACVSNDNAFILVPEKDARIPIQQLHEHWDELRIQIDIWDPVANDWTQLDDWGKVTCSRTL